MVTQPTKSNYAQFYGEWTLVALRTDARHPFTDANGVVFELTRDGVEKTVMVFEDTGNGYRSCAVAPFVSNGPMYEIDPSPNYLYVPVVISVLTSKYGKTCDGLTFRDRRNGQVILRIGTANTDDYYPYFVSEWTPENIAPPPPDQTEGVSF